jgi:hypothetical protein
MGRLILFDSFWFLLILCLSEYSSCIRISLPKLKAVLGNHQYQNLKQQCCKMLKSPLICSEVFTIQPSPPAFSPSSWIHQLFGWFLNETEFRKSSLQSHLSVSSRMLIFVGFSWWSRRHFEQILIFLPMLSDTQTLLGWYSSARIPSFRQCIARPPAWPPPMHRAPLLRAPSWLLLVTSLFLGFFEFL